MRLRLIRHATLKLEYGGRTLLIDPMLLPSASSPTIPHTPNPRPNPLVDLPITVEEVIGGVDGALVTHTHRDHWDGLAADKLSKEIPLFGQPEDEEKFRSQGFMNVHSVTDSELWDGIEITRTSGQHGKGEIGKAMAPVSGFVLRATGEPTVYIAGDTIWCEEVESALARYRPQMVIVNAGAAQFLEGGPITMNADDVIRTCQAAPHSRVIAVHMEAINHCLLTRSDLAFQLESARLADKVAIPQDGEWVLGPD